MSRIDMCTTVTIHSPRHFCTIGHSVTSVCAVSEFKLLEDRISGIKAQSIQIVICYDNVVQKKGHNILTGSLISMLGFNNL